MAINQINISTPAPLQVFTDSAMGNAVDGIKAGAAQLYAVTVNNLGNATPVYVKLYNLASGAVTVGTTAPDMVIYAPGSMLVAQNFYSQSAPQLPFATALSAACVTTGGTAGTISPAVAVPVSVTYV
jgi:hypothetical protein